MNPLVFRFPALMLCTFWVLQCTHAPETTPGLPEVPLDTLLNEKIAGVYHGAYTCGTYDGTSYGSAVTPGNIEIAAVGADSLAVSITEGCVSNYWPFRYDSSASDGQTYTIWRSVFQQYSGIQHFDANDSLVVFTPEHYSIGWLSRSFNGKKT